MHKNGFSLILIIGITAVLVILGIIAFSQFSKKSGENNLRPQEATIINKQERKLVALGASVTKANNLSANLKSDNPDYSFVTGTKIDSLYLFLKNKGENITPVNLAESGADSRSVLDKQVSNAVSFYPKYVTIDMTTDILQNDSPQNLISNLSAIVTQVRREDTTMLVGSYPNFPKMRSASHPSCKEDKLKVGFEKLTSEKISIFNKAIDDFTKENNLVFVNIYETLGPEDVSEYDCVHPNIVGQKKLAKVWIDALKQEMR